MHVLRDYGKVKAFWSHIISEQNWSKFFSLGLHAWLDWNLSTNNVGTLHGNWSTIFGVSIWLLWNDQNSLIFSGESDVGESLWHTVYNKVAFIIQESSLPSPIYVEDSRKELHVA